MNVINKPKCIIGKTLEAKTMNHSISRFRYALNVLHIQSVIYYEKYKTQI